MRLDPDLENRLAPAFERAFRDMDALEKGALANIDEGRRVGHFWLREPDLAPDPAIREAIRAGIDGVAAFADGVLAGDIRPPKAPRFTDLLSIGIGGSALGPQFVAEALAPGEPPVAVHFLDNTDPAGFDRVLARLDGRLESTLVLEITKSGSTPEPRNGLAEVRHAFERRGLHLPSQAVAITSPGSKMDRLAESEGWLARFALYEWIGGRTSVMSPVGLLPAALQGIDTKAFLEGARVMDIATRVPVVRKNPAALLALAWWGAGDGRGLKDMVVLPYKDSLLLFSRYLQQLIMESLGKEKDLDGKVVHQGLAVYGNKGSTDQHAFVQQLREGIPNFFATFIEVLEDRDGPSIEVEPGITSGDYLSGFLQGTRKALYDNGRDSVTVTIPRVEARTVGALIALYERAVGLYASLVHVNAFHQPGVEAGKAAAESVLALQRKLVEALPPGGEALELESLAARAGIPGAVESVYLIVRHLAANGRGIAFEGDPGHPASLKVSRA
jgi:glucose-6-phosphate isomerase